MKKFKGIAAAARETKHLNGHNGRTQITYDIANDKVRATYYVDVNSWHTTGEGEVTMFVSVPMPQKEIKEQLGNIALYQRVLSTFNTPRGKRQEKLDRVMQLPGHSYLTDNTKADVLELLRYVIDEEGWVCLYNHLYNWNRISPMVGVSTIDQTLLDPEFDTSDDYYLFSEISATYISLRDDICAYKYVIERDEEEENIAAKIYTELQKELQDTHCIDWHWADAVVSYVDNIIATEKEELNK
jgi:hypothetical protein